MEIIAIEDIVTPSWSCNEFDEQRFSKLCIMVRKFGQLRSVAVREVQRDSITGVLRRWEVIEGRNIVEACRRSSIPFIWAQNVGVVSDVDAMSISLILNELQFKPDFVDIALLVQKLVRAAGINRVQGLAMFDKRDIEKFIRITKFDWEAFNRAKKEGHLSLFEQNLQQGADLSIVEGINLQSDEEREVYLKTGSD